MRNIVRLSVIGVSTAAFGCTSMEMIGYRITASDSAPSDRASDTGSEGLPDTFPDMASDTNIIPASTESESASMETDTSLETDVPKETDSVDTDLKETDSSTGDTVPKETDAPSDDTAFVETDSSLVETDSSLVDTSSGESSTVGSDGATDTGSEGGMFPMIFDFNQSDDGFSGGLGSAWTWNQAEGTYDLDVSFTSSPSWQSIELYVSVGVWPGGVDWSGATSIEYRYRTVVSNGGFFRAYFQSIEKESTTSETWFWYAEDQDLVPDGEWRTLSLDLSRTDLVNLCEVTKVGLQIHGIEVPIAAGDTDTEVLLPEPEHVVVQVDSVIVRGM